MGALVSTTIRRSTLTTNGAEPIYAELVVDELVGTALALPSEMQHATKATLSDAHVQPPADRTFSAYLRLRQGASARATWVLEESPGGTMISVGADLVCDWQLRAAFVPARAFSMLVVGGRTFIRSGPEPGVLLNGKVLDEGWVAVPDRARIDVGLAQLEVTMGYSEWAPSIDQAFDLRSPFNPATHADDDREAHEAVHELRDRKPQTGAHGSAQAQGTRRHDTRMHETRDYGADARERSPAARARNPTRNPTMELSLDDLDYMGTQAVPSARQHAVSGEFEVRDEAEGDETAPSLLGNTRARDKSKLWRYAVAGVFTAGAYGCWVYLLDYL